MGTDYTKMRTRAEEGKLTRSPDYAFGLPTMPDVRTPIISPIIPTYKTTKKKKAVVEEGGGGSGFGSGGLAGDESGLGEGDYAG